MKKDSNTETHALGNLKKSCDENCENLEGLRLGYFRVLSRHFRGNASGLTLLSDSNLI